MPAEGMRRRETAEAERGGRGEDGAGDAPEAPPQPTGSLVVRVINFPFRLISHAASWVGYYLMFCPKRTHSPFHDYFHAKYVANAKGAGREGMSADESGVSVAPAGVGLPFFEGSFNQAAAEAKRQYKFLLVYLHSEDHPDTRHFCENTLQDPRLLNIVLDNCVLWGASVSESEGYIYSEKLHATTYPFLGLVVASSSKSELVLQMGGQLTSEVVLEKLTNTIANAEPVLVAARADAHERELRERLREEQDREYEETMQRDRERMEERKKERLEAERQKMEREREEAEQREREEREAEEEAKREKRAAEARLAAANDLKEEPEAGPGVSTLRITLANGQAISRRFLTSDKMAVVWTFVRAQPAYDGRDFALATPPPVQSLQPDQTLQEAGLAGRAVVHVRPI